MATDNEGNPVYYNYGQAQNTNARARQEQLQAEQLQDEREMQAEKETELKRQGAIDALETLKEKIQDHRAFAYRQGFDSAQGLTTALILLGDCLKDLDEPPVEVGGEFPEGYFEDTVAKGGAA
jgi:hypothetical protein